MIVPAWILAWRVRRRREHELEERARLAEQAARAARRQWPEVRRAADTFAGDMERAMRKREST